ncbi:MAG TPA: hypothetical protein VHN17_15660 [Steroidobacteraceae bacterium]|jgi:hypothetical protein|nr:hypothetical protein [Steroidobacteraceae bacterium]
MCRLRVELFGIAASTLLIVGCNGSSLDGSDTGSTPTNASATGVWSGSDSVSGLGITALINSSGQANFIRSDGVQFVGSVQVSGDAIAGTVGVYSNFGTAFADASTHGLGTLNGSVTSAGAMTVSLSFTTDAGTAASGNWSLSFDTLTSSGSSLTAISGNYTDGTTGATVSISGAGQMNSQDAATGCVLNGSLSTMAGSIDVYQVAYSYENCSGAPAVLNGVPFTGLAVLNGNASPAQVIIGVSGQSTASGSTVYYGIVSYLDGS